MNTYADRLKHAMSRASITIAGLARRLDVSYTAVAKVLNGKSNGFGTENNFKAAHFLDVDPYWLSTGDGPMISGPSAAWTRTTEHQNLIRKPVTLLTVGRIPLLNQGNTRMLDSYMDGTADHQPPSFTYHSDNTTGLFAYTVPDDLMEPRIPNGCTAIININAEPLHGKFVLVQDGDRSYIRRLVIDGDLRYLETISGRLPAKPLTGSIIGAVKEVVISMDD